VQFCITYRPETNLPPEVVEAEHATVEGEANVVLRGTVLVIGQPREVVVRRIRAVDVLRVDELPAAVSPSGSGTATP
jgi:hypothetical protein